MSLVGGALAELTRYYNFEKDGDLTPEQTAEYFSKMVSEWYASEDCLLDPSDAPFRDEPDGEDAIESIGTGTPWYEDVADWFVAAYLAVTFTPAAGVFYITTLRNIRLQFRARNYGAIASIFLDDVLQVDVDTYSPTDELIDVFLRGEPPPGFMALDVETHEIRIVHSGEHNEAATAAADGYAIEVIRDYIGLEVGTRRYVSETDTIEILINDKQEWLPIDPASDPRRITNLPPREGSDPRCDAAENLTAGIKTWVDNNIASLTLGSSAASLTSILFLSFPFIEAKIIGIIEGMLAALFTAGASGMTVAFTSGVYDTLKCYFYDAMDSDGRMTQATLADVEAKIFDEPGGTVYNVMRVLFATSGEGGLNDLAATGTLEGDCSGCEAEWCYIWTLGDNLGNWSIYPGQPGSVGAGGLETGLVFVGDDPARGRVQTFIEFLSFPGTASITSITAAVNMTNGVGTDLTGNGIAVNNFDHFLALTGALPDGDTTIGWGGEDGGIASIQIIMSAGGCDTCGDPGGVGLMTTITITGTGTLPTEFLGGEEC